MNGLIVLAALMMPPDAASQSMGSIFGTVVDGSAEGQVLAGAEVVLRAGQGNSLAAIATTITDSDGRFAFENLPTDDGLVYLPGANRRDVHYPGKRLRLDRQHPTADVQLLAYDAVESPSPLVVRRHEIAIRVAAGSMEITESLLIENPSRTAYVGEAHEDRPTITLRMALPEGFETVTFDTEFHGRNFLAHNNALITELPWPPGKRELKFQYRLPIEKRSTLFRRVLDLPTDALLVQVSGQDPAEVACNLSARTVTASQEQPEVVFAHQGGPLPAGHELEVRMGDLPVRWEKYVRWLAVGVLSLLLAWTAWVYRQRRAQAAWPQRLRRRDRRGAAHESRHPRKPQSV